MEKPLITKAQAAAKGDVCERTIERSIKEGKLRAQKFYGRVLIAESDFDAFLAARSNAPMASSGIETA
jgi:excisionase family DNA binding protein